MKKITLFVFVLFILSAKAQVGVGTTSPIDGAILEVESSDKGVMIPRMDITDLTTLAPVTKLPASPEPIGLLVFNTDATNGGANQGFYYWDGNDWIAIAGGSTSNDWTELGNAGTVGGTTTTDGTNFIGTTDDQNLNFRTNNVFRGRFSNLGEFFVGTQATVVPGDLMNAVGNTVFPWAVNGYTDFNGGGVYGSVTSGNTAFAGVQGEYIGTNLLGPGVRGITFTTSPGTDFDGNTVAGVKGSFSDTFFVNPSGDNIVRGFGVFGDVGNFRTRTGGVLGTDLFARGALGYYASNGLDYSVYGFGTNRVNGVAGGRMSESVSLDTHIGLGIYGGFLGGWIKGHEYGAILSGDRFGSYINGKSITNDSYVVLNETASGDKAITYATTSVSIDVQSKGVGQLSNGYCEIKFEKSFASIAANDKPIIVTVTPFGESNGVHLVSVTHDGFIIKENNNGSSNVKFNWIAIAEKAHKSETIAKELLTKEFDENINALMHNDDLDGGKAIWMENGTLQYGSKAPLNPIKIETSKKIKKTSRVTREKSQS